jgi:hypothetical protein
METISSKVSNKIGWLVTPILLNIVLEFLARKIKQKKEIKWMDRCKEEVKLLLFANDPILKRP